MQDLSRASQGRTPGRRRVTGEGLHPSQEVRLKVSATDVIAGYAAIVATAALGWEIWKEKRSPATEGRGEGN